jgi:hypothetical protein
MPLLVEELSKMVLESGFISEADDRYELTGRLPPQLGSAHTRGGPPSQGNAHAGGLSILSSCVTTADETHVGWLEELVEVSSLWQAILRP